MQVRPESQRTSTEATRPSATTWAVSASSRGVTRRTMEAAAVAARAATAAAAASRRRMGPPFGGAILPRSARGANGRGLREPAGHPGRGGRRAQGDREVVVPGERQGLDEGAGEGDAGGEEEVEHRLPRAPGAERDHEGRARPRRPE